MKFKGHESFYIRRGWLYKGLKNVRENEAVFLAKDAMEQLGLGSNMVKSLRYWMQATGLTTECSEHGRRVQYLTPLGQLIWKYDPYMEEMGTLWIIHAKLALQRELATSWYIFFNEFAMQTFQKEDFVRYVQQYTDAAESSLASDFDCLISTYMSRSLLKGKTDPESNTDCPLGELELLAPATRQAKLYCRKEINPKTIPMLVFLAVLYETVGERRELKIKELFSGTAGASVGRIFQLELVGLMQILYQLEKAGYLKVIRTAGLDVIRLRAEGTALTLVEEYYRDLVGEG